MKNILIAGVGGQGSLLASRILGAYYLRRGLTVKVSEVHGMSQRGGSVVTYVRAGADVSSPLIPQGQAHMLIALEQLEALRWLPHMAPGGAVVMSLQQILPMPVITGMAEYPVDIVSRVKEGGFVTVALDAQQLAEQAGNVRASNVVLLGAASLLLGGELPDWEEALAACLKPKLLAVNQKAFMLGRGIVI